MLRLAAIITGVHGFGHFTVEETSAPTAAETFAPTAAETEAANDDAPDGSTDGVGECLASGNGCDVCCFGCEDVFGSGTWYNYYTQGRLDFSSMEQCVCVDAGNLAFREMTLTNYNDCARNQGSGYMYLVNASVQRPRPDAGTSE